MDSNWHEDKLGAIWTVRRVARNILLVAFWTALFAVFGIAYLSIAATEYTADATVIVVFDNERTGNEDRLQAELETHRSLISSDASLVAVLGRIDIDLPAQSDGFAVKTIDSIRRMLSREPLVPAKGRTQSGADDAEGIYPAQFRRIAPAIRERLEIERIGQSRLLRLSYSASSAEAAVAFVNALAQVYSELSALPLAAGDKGQLTREPTGVAPSDPAEK